MFVARSHRASLDAVASQSSKLRILQSGASRVKKALHTLGFGFVVSPKAVKDSTGRMPWTMESSVPLVTSVVSMSLRAALTSEAAIAEFKRCSAAWF